MDAPLHGITSRAWQVFAVAVTWSDNHAASRNQGGVSPSQNDSPHRLLGSTAQQAFSASITHVLASSTWVSVQNICALLLQVRNCVVNVER